MSVEFSNAYQEILLDNLISIIKQNFMFQTQLKLAEETQIKFNELNKTKSEVNLTAHEEKNRLQAALNDIMKKNSLFKKDLEAKDTEIASLKEYIEKLENIATPSKLKKINPEKFVDEKLVEQPTSDLFAIKVNDGSMF